MLKYYLMAVDNKNKSEEFKAKALNYLKLGVKNNPESSYMVDELGRYFIYKSKDFIKLKEIGDKIISKISKRDELDLLLRYHYYSLLMGYNNSGNMRRIIMLNIKTSIGFEDELLNIYSKLLSKKDFPYKDRIIEQINRGEESIIVQGLFKKEDDKYGITTKNNLHNSSIALIDYLYFDDLIYQESLSYMTYSYIYILKNMVDNYKKQQEGGMNYIVKFCVKL